MSNTTLELTERDFDLAIPRSQRERIMRGELADGSDVVALRRFVGLTQAAATGIIPLAAKGNSASAR